MASLKGSGPKPAKPLASAKIAPSIPQPQSPPARPAIKPLSKKDAKIKGGGANGVA